MWQVIEDRLERPNHRALRETCSALRSLTHEADIRRYEKLWARQFQLNDDSSDCSNFDRDYGFFVPEGLEEAWEGTP